MLFTAYKNNVVYSNQPQISLPKASTGERTGFGIINFVASPNRTKSLEFISKDILNLAQSQNKRYITDVLYRYKIGASTININERQEIDELFKNIEAFPLDYINTTSRAMVISKKYNLINDISRWMEIFFSYSSKLTPQKKCAEFIKLLKFTIDSSSFDEYGKKLLVIDIDSWVAKAKSCVMLNPSLLTNPLSILMYTAIKFPDEFSSLKDLDILLVGTSSMQLCVMNTSFIKKDNLPKIKSILSKFEGVAFTNESDNIVTDKSIQDEVTASIVEDIKDKVTTKVKEAITNSSKDIEDADTNVSISSLIDDELEDIDDLDSIDIDELTDKVADNAKEIYKSSFLPTKTPEQLAKIDILLKNQKDILARPVSVKDTKSIPTTELGSMIGIKNPNLAVSKFKNFDKAYTEKLLQKNIDDAVAILSKTDNKIFVTNKTVEDSSSPLDIKSTYTYKLEDEKGNKMSLVFDVPTIIDDSYIFINGTKKNIIHQFVLKPIVKTGEDTVQIVTAYNKVFIKRVGKVSQNINLIRTYITKNADAFDAIIAPCASANGDYDMPLDHNIMAKAITKFTFGDEVYIFNINDLLKTYLKTTKKELVFDKNTEYPIGYNKKSKSPIIINRKHSFTEYMLNTFSQDEKTLDNIRKVKRKPRLIMSTAKLLTKEIPLVLFMLYCEGFSSVTRAAGIDYRFIQKEDIKKYDALYYDFIKLEDGYIAWNKTNFEHELLMNGLKYSDLSEFTYAELDSKDTYVALMMEYFKGDSNIYHSLDNFRDFLLDDKTKDILADLGYPTTLIPLMVVANNMLTDTNYLIENNLNNMRIRSNEVIADVVYKTVTSVYNNYRKTAYKKKPTKISVKKSAIIDKLLSSQVNMIEEFSTLNPILELEKSRSVTFKGMSGIQKDRALTVARRSYDATMLGTIGITTSPDANVGVVRQITMEPQITSTYGYIDTNPSDNLDSLNNTNLFTLGELINPFGITHDDPDRSSMSMKQTKYMLPIKDADPVFVGNKVEQVIPYLLSDEFIVDAKDDGKVVDISNGYCVVEYKNGKRFAIDISTRLKKNSSQGTWADNTLKCDLKVGDTFLKGDILAYNEREFTPNRDGRGAALNLGSLVKIAISSQWDGFEDSVPISRRAAKKLATDIVDEKGVSMSRYTHVDKIVKIGDKIKAGETLIKFADAIDEDTEKLLASMRDDTANSIVEDAKHTIASKYTGEIADIKIYTTVESEELSPSLKEIVDTYQKKIKKRNKTLDKYKNEGDMNFYKAGQVITETENLVEVPYSGKVKGHIMDPEDDVLILFYIKYELSASKGDKVAVSVSKGIISHVFDEGKEPYSEYRPDEIIDTITPPLSVAARKIPAIFLTIFSNKLIIELKNQLRGIYEE